MRLTCPNGCVGTDWTGSADDAPDCLWCGASRTPSDTITPGDGVDIRIGNDSRSATYDGLDDDGMMVFRTDAGWVMRFHDYAYHNNIDAGGIALHS